MQRVNWSCGWDDSIIESIELRYGERTSESRLKEVITGTKLLIWKAYDARVDAEDALHDPARVAERTAGLGESLPPLTANEASVEAARCLMCFDAPCTHACPTHIDIPKFIKKISTGNLLCSARHILESN